MGALWKAGQYVNGRAIFCLTDHSIASLVCQIRAGGRRVFINPDGKHGAVQSPSGNVPQSNGRPMKYSG